MSEIYWFPVRAETPLLVQDKLLMMQQMPKKQLIEMNP
jgi:hypothetical protein